MAALPTAGVWQSISGEICLAVRLFTWREREMLPEKWGRMLPGFRKFFIRKCLKNERRSLGSWHSTTELRPQVLINQHFTS